MPNIEQDLIKGVIDVLTTATLAVLKQHKLGGSKMERSVKWSFERDAFQLWALDYFDYVDKGRRKGARRIPVEALVKWMKQYGIQPFRGQTYNQAAFHISNAIFKVGLKGRNYKNKILDDSAEIIAEMLADEFEFAIADELAETMTFKL